MGRAVKDRWVGPEDVLRAVAVVDVEVDDRHPFGAMPPLRVPGRDRRVIEETKAHRGFPLGMVPRRTGRDESVDGPPVHHLVDRQHGAARRMGDRRQRTGVHRGVRV